MGAKSSKPQKNLEQLYKKESGCCHNYGKREKKISQAKLLYARANNLEDRAYFELQKKHFDEAQELCANAKVKIKEAISKLPPGNAEVFDKKLKIITKLEKEIDKQKREEQARKDAENLRLRDTKKRMRGNEYCLSEQVDLAEKQSSELNDNLDNLTKDQLKILAVLTKNAREIKRICKYYNPQILNGWLNGDSAEYIFPRKKVDKHIDYINEKTDLFVLDSIQGEQTLGNIVNKLKQVKVNSEFYIMHNRNLHWVCYGYRYKSNKWQYAKAERDNLKIQWLDIEDDAKAIDSKALGQQPDGNACFLHAARNIQALIESKEKLPACILERELRNEFARIIKPNMINFNQSSPRLTC